MSEQQSSNYRTFFKAAFLVGVPVILSRLLGLVREQYSLYLFGAGWELDAYISAYRIPTVLRNLLGEGAFSVVFISIFSALWPRNRRSAQKFTNQVITYLMLFSAIICFFAFVFTPNYMTIIHRSSENFDLAVHLSRIMVFFINFISIAGILMGILNSQAKYIVPAMAPAVANIFNIFIIYLGHERLGIDILAVGYLSNAIAILFLQIPFVIKAGVHFRFDFSISPRLKFFLKSFFPVAFGMAFFQFNQLLTNSFSSQVEGGNSVMDKSFLVIQMAIAVLSAGVSTALLPAISREKNIAVKKQIYTEGMKVTCLVVFPSMILFIAFGLQISSFVYQDLILLVAGNLGKIEIGTIEEIGQILVLFAPGILIYALVTMVTRAFQGMGLYIYPFIGSGISTIINLFIMYYFFPKYGLIVLPISLILASCCDLILLMIILGFRTQDSVFSTQHMRFIVQNIIAGTCMYYIIKYVYSLSFHLASNIIILPLCLGLGFVVYFILLLFLREEITLRIYRAFYKHKNKLR